MAEITLKSMWGKSDPDAIRDAQAFWRSLGGAVTADEIEERIPQLCAVAYDGGKVVGVSTVFLYDYLRLRARFAYYRTRVAESHRRQRLSAKLCAHSRDILAQWAREHPEERLKGLFIIPQAREYRGELYAPIIKRHGFEFVLVGYTPGGHQIRILWFDDAHVQ
jgi:hypothetical protein